MTSTTLSSKGQVTLPKVVLDTLRLKPGETLEVVVEGAQIVLRRTRYTLGDLCSVLPKPTKKVPLEEMDIASREGAVKRSRP